MSETFSVTNPAACVTLFPDAPQWDGHRTMALGGFACDTGPAGAAVLAEAEAAARAQGAERLLAPMDGTTWNPYRLVTESDATPPFLMEPVSGPEDEAAFTAAGFTQVAQYFSARLSLATMHNPAPLRPFDIEIWDGKDPEARFGEVYELSLEAFARNAFYTPISRAAFLGLYMPHVPMMRPEFLLFARDPSGRLVGFLFGIPNFAEGPRPTSVILKTYASRAPGAGQALAWAFHNTARDAGFTHAIHALIHETNGSARRSARLGAEVFRRYALLGKRLT